MKKNPAATIAVTALIAGIACPPALKATGTGERIEQVAGDVLPVWREETGVYVEVNGRYVATGDASIVLRMVDEKSPLTMVWNSAGNWQLLAPGALQRDFSTQGGGNVAATWRLRLRGFTTE